MFTIVVVLVGSASILLNLRGMAEPEVNFSGILKVAVLFIFWGIVLFNERAISVFSRATVRFVALCARRIWDWLRTNH